MHTIIIFQLINMFLPNINLKKAKKFITTGLDRIQFAEFFFTSAHIVVAYNLEGGAGDKVFNLRGYVIVRARNYNWRPFLKASSFDTT